jgi:hypothetical protein
VPGTYPPDVEIAAVLESNLVTEVMPKVCKKVPLP